MRPLQPIKTRENVLGREMGSLDYLPKTGLKVVNGEANFGHGSCEGYGHRLFIWAPCAQLNSLAEMKPRNSSPPPAFGFIYEGAIG